MHALTSLHKRRKTPTRQEVADLQVQLRPTPKLADTSSGAHKVFFDEMA